MKIQARQPLVPGTSQEMVLQHCQQEMTVADLALAQAQVERLRDREAWQRAEIEKLRATEVREAFVGTTIRVAGVVLECFKTSRGSEVPDPNWWNPNDYDLWWPLVDPQVDVPGTVADIIDVHEVGGEMLDESVPFSDQYAVLLRTVSGETMVGHLNLPASNESYTGLQVLEIFPVSDVQFSQTL